MSKFRSSRACQRCSQCQSIAKSSTLCGLNVVSQATSSTTSPRSMSPTVKLRSKNPMGPTMLRITPSYTSHRRRALLPSSRALRWRTKRDGWKSIRRPRSTRGMRTCSRSAMRAVCRLARRSQLLRPSRQFLLRILRA